jgi:hypothetical protein
MSSIINKTDFINPKWNSYDRTVAKAQLSNFGCIFLDEYGCPIDNEYALEKLTGGTANEKGCANRNTGSDALSL